MKAATKRVLVWLWIILGGILFYLVVALMEFWGLLYLTAIPWALAAITWMFLWVKLGKCLYKGWWIDV